MINAARIYAALLRLYPRQFRQEYGDDMLAAFGEMRTRWVRGPIAFWTFVLRDTLGAAARERLDGMRWLATAACGLLMTTLTGDGAAWAYRYFYHPYFEGATVRVLPYGVALGFVLGASVAVAQRLLFPPAERRTRQWALASAIALPMTVFFCSAAIDRATAGVLPIANAHPRILNVFVFRLPQPQGWIDLSAQFAAMGVAAVVVRALLITRPVRSSHAH
jgi:hypothetical protein